MDFYLTSLPTIRERPSNDISSMHRMLVQELDLAVMLFLDEEEKDRIDPSDVDKHNEKDNIRLALRQIASVLAAMNSLGRKMLDSLDSDKWETKIVR
jgi:midasin